MVDTPNTGGPAPDYMAFFDAMGDGLFKPTSQGVIFKRAESITGIVIPPENQTPEMATVLAALMYKDRQTGLSSFEHFLLEVGHDIIEKNIIAAAGVPQKPSCIAFCDLNHFKDYNTTLGEHTTDFLLTSVSHAIEETVTGVIKKNIRINPSQISDDKRGQTYQEKGKKTRDIAARRSGDEFLVFMPDSGLKVINDRMTEIANEIAQKKFLIKKGNDHYLIENVTLAHGAYEIPPHLSDRLSTNHETLDNYIIKLEQTRMAAAELVDRCEDGMKEKKRAMKEHAAQNPDAPSTKPTITVISSLEAERLKTQPGVVEVNVSEKERSWIRIP